MALLDFIKNRGEQRPAAEQQSQQQRTDNAKQMYTHEAAQEKANARPVEAMSVEDQAQAKAIGEKMKSIPMEPETPPTSPAAPSSAPAPTEGTDNQQAMKQLSMAQDKTAPDLSPSSAQMGMKEVDAPAAPSVTPSSTPAPPKPSRSMSPGL